MASNSFGNRFRITTFGESHGEVVGVVIDGCPANLSVSIDEIEGELERRRPGKSKYTSPRKESDKPKIVSGYFDGRTTGAPITILFENEDVETSGYRCKNIYKPGHAHFTYQMKYGIFDHRGSGRASARETVCRVAAGAIAKKIIAPMVVTASIDEIGGCSDETKQREILDKVKEEGDSIGSIVSCRIENVLPGLGDPIYGKLESMLAHAMLSIPAVKGVEFGVGFAASKMRGSEFNGEYHASGTGVVYSDENNCGGMNGGISNGNDIVFRIVFRPPSSITMSQQSMTVDVKSAVYTMPKEVRNDVCIAYRALPVVEAMVAIVLADVLLY